MKTAIALLGFAVLICCFFSSSSAHKSGHHKTATFYTPPYMPSACYGNSPNGTRIAAASTAIWDHGKACGRKYRVKCIGATNDGVLYPCRGESVDVKIVDLCPHPVCRGTIDLSQESFLIIADPDAGVVRIELIEL